MKKALFLSIITLFCAIAGSAIERRRRIVVAADGRGDFLSVQQAVDQVPENNAARFIIHIKPGVYRGQINVPASKPFITFEGERAERTVLTFNLSAKEAGKTSASCTVYVGASDFRAENVTFENSYGTGSQAVALFVDADRAVFRNCRFLGWQDTLYAHGGRQYYKDCYIEGHVDFIFGSAAAVFENCRIHSKGQGYITAHWRLSDAETNGYVFRNCRLTGADTGKGVYLGRPWRPYGRVVFLRCRMDAHIRPEGWDNWRDAEREKTAWFAEYKSTGRGAQTRARVGWSRQLTDREAQMFSTASFLKGSDGWNPAAR
jgi:pectinesterase